MIYYYCLLLLNFICSIILVNTSRPKCFHSFLCFFSSTSMLSRVWRSLYRRWVLFGPSKDFLQTSHVSRPVWGASMDADPFFLLLNYHQHFSHFCINSANQNTKSLACTSSTQLSDSRDTSLARKRTFLPRASARTLLPHSSTSTAALRMTRSDLLMGFLIFSVTWLFLWLFIINVSWCTWHVLQFYREMCFKGWIIARKWAHS